MEKVTGELPEEYRKQREEAGLQESGHYRVENSSHVFAAMCFFLSAVNAGFAVVVILFHDKIRGEPGKETPGDFEMQNTEPKSDANYTHYDK